MMANSDFMKDEIDIKERAKYPILELFHDLKIDMRRLQQSTLLPMKSWSEYQAKVNNEITKPHLKEMMLTRYIVGWVDNIELVISLQREQINVLRTTLNKILDYIQVGSSGVDDEDYEDDDAQPPYEKPRFDPVESEDGEGGNVVIINKDEYLDGNEVGEESEEKEVETEIEKTPKKRGRKSKNLKEKVVEDDNESEEGGGSAFMKAKDEFDF